MNEKNNGKKKPLEIKLNLVRCSGFKFNAHSKYPISYNSEIYLNNRVIGKTLTPCTINDFCSQLIKEAREHFTL
tara:strand:+ start:2121 stop:2342 length:222 start_codon:yes stop_codon:yes gene_type:complete